MNEEHARSTSHTYACDFGHGLRVVITLDASMITPGKPVNETMTVVWSGSFPTTPTGRKKILRDYCRWKHTVLQSFADMTGLRILDATQTAADEIVVRTYSPR